MKPIRVGVQLSPQHTTYAAYAQAVCEAEALGVDTIWNWDHFFPPFDDPPEGEHFEGWTLLTAMAMLTHRAEVGCLVTCNSYRNPALLANMAKTVDHISGGRLILGLGAGWFETDYREYGYPFGTDKERLQDFASALPLIKQRWELEKPLPVRMPIPILIGGDGERVTLKLAAQYADIWNGGSKSPEAHQHKCTVLDQWCAAVGRDPATIERSVSLNPGDEARYDQYLAAGAQHIVLMMDAPWDLKPVERLMRWRDRQAGR
jgi:probable F420-dependent oxidoreductase